MACSHETAVLAADAIRHLMNDPPGRVHPCLPLGQVENIALLSNAPEHGFVGVNMYVDDEGSIKELPVNVRASDIANCCVKPMEVRNLIAKM